jgi:hypothetical protein
MSPDRPAPTVGKVSQHLLLGLWVDPLRADRLGARRPRPDLGRDAGPSLEPEVGLDDHPRPWVPGRWQAAFANTSAGQDGGRTPVPAVRVPVQRLGSPTDDQQPARSGS